MGDGLDEPVVIFAPGDRARLDRGMLQQEVFDFRWTDPDAADLQHVVRAPGEPEEAVLVLLVLIAGPDPVAGDRVLRLFVLIPVERTRRVSLDDQIAELAPGNLAPVLVDEARFVAGDRDSARAGTHAPGLVRDEDVQDLCRADAVEDLDAE